MTISCYMQYCKGTGDEGIGAQMGRGDQVMVNDESTGVTEMTGGCTAKAESR